MAETDSDEEQVKEPTVDDDLDEQPKDRQEVDVDEADELDEPPRRRHRVDPDEVDEFDEWRSERRSKGRKPRRHGDDRRRQRDDFDDV